MAPCDIFDIIAFGIVAIGCLLGLFRGLSGELARIAAMLGAFISCSLLGPVWRSFCQSWCGNSRFLYALVSIVGILVVAALSGWLIRKFVDKCLRVLVPQPANAILGGIFGTIAAFCLAALLCLLLNLIPLEFVRDSLLGPSRFWKFAQPLATAAQSWF